MCVYTHNSTTSESKTLYEICVLLGKYTTYSGKSLPTPKARTDSLSRQVGRNYHNKPRNFPVERNSPLLRVGSLKSWKHCVSAQYAPCTHLATRVANIQFFPPILVGLVPLFGVDFSILASEASGFLRHFRVKTLECFFCNKHLCLYSALAALDYIYSNQKSDMHAIASYVF